MMILPIFLLPLAASVYCISILINLWSIFVVDSSVAFPFLCVLIGTLTEKSNNKGHVALGDEHAKSEKFNDNASSLVESDVHP